MARRFEVGTDEFRLDGRPFRILSGSMNYFRLVPPQWRDRIDWARHMGLNTIETYVPWNLHAPAPGRTSFDGMLDLVRFLETVAEVGLNAIVRPGPYVCAELDFGGLPAWLLRPPGMRLRSSDPVYLDHVSRWFDELFPRLTPLQCTNGGPILAMQVENEFGAFGRDPDYLDWLIEQFTSRGVEVPLLTSDQDDVEMITHGGRTGLLATMNFGSNPLSAWETRRRVQAAGPKMCMEFWNGWFDHWGEDHHRRPAEDVAAVLDEILDGGASVNFYMFCGGTNFGFTNGANHFDRYQSTITSYDYDAPLSEDGAPTKKFQLYKDVIARHCVVAETARPPLNVVLPEQTVALTHTIGLLDAAPLLANPVRAAAPATMEALGQSFGFVLYGFDVTHEGTYVLHVPGVRDRGQVLVDGAEQGILDREHGITSLVLRVPRPLARVEILVENLGRINYGPELADPKGIVGEIRLNDTAVTAITMYPLPLDDFSGLAFDGEATTRTDGPVLCRGRFTVDEPADTFVALPGWCKGVVWVNGFNLGRYWDRGPQRTLYLPGPLLRAGDNELHVLELHHLLTPKVLLTTTPDLG